MGMSHSPKLAMMIRAKGRASGRSKRGIATANQRRPATASIAPPILLDGPGNVMATPSATATSAKMEPTKTTDLLRATNPCHPTDLGFSCDGQC